jgi:competence protein ComEC
MCRCSGRVIDLPDHRAAHTRFLLQVRRAANCHLLRGKRLQVTWNDRGKAGPAPLAEAAQAVLAGAQWQLSLRVQAPRSRINPGALTASAMRCCVA